MEIVRDGVSVLVMPGYAIPVVAGVPRESLALSLEEIENDKELNMFVLRDVYDATNERVLIVEGSHISGPMEVRIADGQVSLTIAGNYLHERGWVIGGGMGGHLIEPRTLIGECLRVAANPEEWRADILRNPVLSATLLFTGMDDANGSDSSIRRC